jgi:hypothetical protein
MLEPLLTKATEFLHEEERNRLGRDPAGRGKQLER